MSLWFLSVQQKRMVTVEHGPERNRTIVEPQPLVRKKALKENVQANHEMGEVLEPCQEKITAKNDDNGRSDRAYNPRDKCFDRCTD